MKIVFHTNTSVQEVTAIHAEELPYTYLDGYRKFIKDKYQADVVLAVEQEQGICIAMSILRSKFITNAQLLSEPFTANGPLAAAEQERFYNELIGAMKEQGIADRLITPQNFVVLGAAPAESKSCGFGSYIVDLTPTQEELLARVHSKHRNKINKADRAGVIIKSGRQELPVFYELYAATMKRSSMYCEPYTFFESLYNTLGEEHCLSTVVYHNGQPQGGILAPYTKYCCYYVYGASADTITESGSINFLHWHTMLLMKDQDVRAYDFVGARLSDVSNTKLEGIQSFKERFGGTLKKGYLFKMDINSVRCGIFDSLVKTKNIVSGKAAFKDIIDQEIEKQST